MSITVYGYSTVPGISTVTGFGSSIESVIEELRDVRAEIALEERDAGALHGHVGAGAHGDADVGLGEGGGIVDAVARHGHLPPFRLQPLDDLALLLRLHLGHDLI